MPTQWFKFHRYWKSILFLLMIGAILWSLPSQLDAKTSKANAPAPSADSFHPSSVEEMNQLVSRLSDEQVRQILLQQLEKTLLPGKGKTDAMGSGTGMLHSLHDFSTLFHERITEIGQHLPLFFDDMNQAIDKLTGGKGVGNLMEMVLTLLVIIAFSIAVERLWWRLSTNIRNRFDVAPVMEGWMRFTSALLKLLPAVMGIVIFTVTGGILFTMVHFFHGEGWRLLSIAMILAIVVARLAYLVSNLIFDPRNSHLRLIDISDESARHLHQKVFYLTVYYGVFYIFTLFFQKLGLPVDSIFLILLLGSIPFLYLITHLIWSNRSPVADWLRQTCLKSSAGSSWLREQLISGWHIPTLAYLILLWILGLGRFALFGPQHDMAFIISFMIIPLYLALDQIGKWVVRETLGTFKKTEIDETTGYYRTAVSLVRFVIGVSLLLWIFDVWGFRLPFIEQIIQAAFSILVTLILAHIIWGMTNRHIQKKLEAMAPAISEKEDDDDDFISVTLDRSYTLLPMLRKFIGTVLVVMVTLIVLSSMGINIGPLLAGAGVVGLAIGFGAQKLVADVLSGIFYLVDDAFRVGEYIQASSVSGTVEGFTLRNLMLRHHRGALQIVPFSKLGAITNYNRGGMVCKLKLSLPYDTNVDQVRKIIKKVGQSMQDDPEYGPDILRPIKSQGVKSVADSVMTIGVKFTTKPNKQFVIQREVFKRIMEGLAKKGIQFAHRRVIVEMPPGFDKPADPDQSNQKSDSTDSARMEQLKAGAAAALTRMLTEEEQKKKETEANKSEQDS